MRYCSFRLSAQVLMAGSLVTRLLLLFFTTTTRVATPARQVAIEDTQKLAYRRYTYQVDVLTHNYT